MQFLQCEVIFKMEELKNKIFSLINKQAPKIPSMGFSDANYHFNEITTLSINSKTVSEANRPADQDILESIEAAYFSIDENYDICRFELGKLPDETLDCGRIQRDFDTLKRQHQVVSKKVLQLILEHQNSCNEEFKHVLEVLEKVKETWELCKISRQKLSVAKREYQESLCVLANYRKRKLTQNLLKNLKMIKDLYNFDKRLNVLLKEGDYVGAILELQRCQRIANKYRHFTCVAALTYKLQETMENTDTQLDKALAQTCLHFNGDYFGKLQEAFRLLEKPQLSVLDNLHVHYITAIYNQSLNVVQSYVSCPDILNSSDTTGKNPYKTICQSVPQEVFINCLLDLCKVLFKIVLSYHQLISWYSNQDNESSDNSPDREQKLEKAKLEHYLVKIWDDVQRKVSSLLRNVDLARYKFDQFVQVLSVVHRLIQVGDEFCMSKSDDLLESIRIQSINYFKNYHAARLDELRIFFENEMWELCPVKYTFSITRLQEFRSLRSLLKNYKSKTQSPPQYMIPYSTGSNECCSSTHSQDGSSIIGNYFIRHANQGTPFDAGLDETIIDEDILADENDASGYFSEESEEDLDEIKRDISEEDITKTPLKEKREKLNHKAPILTNTTLSVLRQMGKYLQMSRLLRPIAYKIITCMIELFYYYLYVVDLYFASDLPVSSNNLYSNQLNLTLRKISDNMILHMEKRGTGMEDFRVLKPALSPLIDLKKPEKLNGLSERIIAVESLIYLSSQFQALQDFMDFLIPQSNKYMLDQIFQQDVACAVDLRKPVYMAVCAQAFDLRQILTMMSKTNWEVRDVMSQHNHYIDVLLREVQMFTLRLEDIGKKISIPSPVYAALWENIAHIITHTLVEGFSEAKKCTNGGRALMQLDFTQFLSKFEKISGLKPVPHKFYVENYVKAYYLPEYELENWMREHNEYSTKHFYGLVCCVCQNNKKTRQRLLQIVEDMEKNHFADR